MKTIFNAYVDDNYFDWYQGTFKDDEDFESLLRDFVKCFDLSSVVKVSPRVRQYARAVDVVRGDRTLVHLCWGGCNEGVHFISTGSVADDVARHLRCNYSGRYSVSRADIRVDFIEDGAFEYITGLLSKFAIERRIITNHQGDWLTGERGRTLYVGSKSSVAQVRCYEKGKKEGGDPRWVRLEAQIRPAKRRGKMAAADLSALMLWQSTSWLHDFRNLLFIDNGQRNVEILGKKIWTPTNQQRALVALDRQYGKILEAVASGLPDGWSGIGDYLKAFRDAREASGGALSGEGECPLDKDKLALSK